MVVKPTTSAKSNVTSGCHSAYMKPRRSDSPSPSPGRPSRDGRRNGAPPRPWSDGQLSGLRGMQPPTRGDAMVLDRLSLTPLTLLSTPPARAAPAKDVGLPPSSAPPDDTHTELLLLVGVVRTESPSSVVGHEAAEPKALLAAVLAALEPESLRPSSGPVSLRPSGLGCGACGRCWRAGEAGCSATLCCRRS